MHESEEMLDLIYRKRPDLEPLFIFNLQFVLSVLALVDEISSSNDVALKATPLDLLMGINVNDFVQR